ncbi:hypothetical protein ACIQU5_00065 [Streptomyces sp. NPDC090306]|uniref:hypothetical protein n=1 Tax=unclassified Streptomyces TaxID=2593676 RepID=UPI0036E1BF9C
MERSFVLRGGTTLAVGALSLALLTACGGDTDGDKGSGPASGSSSASSDAASGSDASTGKALGAAELKKLIVTTADVDGYKVGGLTGEDAYAASKSDVKVADTACAPLGYAVTGFAPGDSAADAERLVQQTEGPSPSTTASLEDMSDEDIENSMTDAMSINVTMVGLSSYDGDGAAATMKSLSDAVAKCSGGFTVTGGEKQEITKVTAEKPAAAGDESVAFAVTMSSEGEEGVAHAEAVRHGSTVAVYYTINLGRMLSGKAYPVDPAVLKAQEGKFE